MILDLVTITYIYSNILTIVQSKKMEIAEFLA
jgi:hypothetical protein